MAPLVDIARDPSRLALRVPPRRRKRVRLLQPARRARLGLALTAPAAGRVCVVLLLGERSGGERGLERREDRGEPVVERLGQQSVGFVNDLRCTRRVSIL